jgi:hypothetical protein
LASHLLLYQGPTGLKVVYQSLYAGSSSVLRTLVYHAARGEMCEVRIMRIGSLPAAMPAMFCARHSRYAHIEPR